MENKSLDELMIFSLKKAGLLFLLEYSNEHVAKLAHLMIEVWVIMDDGGQCALLK